MDDSIFSIELEHNRFVCLAPLSKEDVERLGVDGLGDHFGYFVYESVGGMSPSQCINVLAKCPDVEAASRLFNLYSAAVAFRAS